LIEIIFSSLPHRSWGTAVIFADLRMLGDAIALHCSASHVIFLMHFCLEELHGITNGPDLVDFIIVDRDAILIFTS